MKNYLLVVLALFVLAGCGSIDTSKIDPVDTGEIIGFTYLMTKNELSEEDRQAVESAYAVFAQIANYTGDAEALDVKVMLFSLIDDKMPADDDSEIARKTAVKLIVNRYWNRVDVKFNLADRLPVEQLSILQQVYIGMERGLGRGDLAPSVTTASRRASAQIR